MHSPTCMLWVFVVSNIYFRVWEGAPTSSVAQLPPSGYPGRLHKPPSTGLDTELRVADIYIPRLSLYQYPQHCNPEVDLFSCCTAVSIKNRVATGLADAEELKAQPGTTQQASSGTWDGALR